MFYILNKGFTDFTEKYCLGIIENLIDIVNLMQYISINAMRETHFKQSPPSKISFHTTTIWVQGKHF